MHQDLHSCSVTYARGTYERCVATLNNYWESNTPFKKKEQKRKK